MAPSYLVKKSDIYYFRHYIPVQIQPSLGRKEFIKSLRVSNKSLAVKISREVKVVFDSIMDKIHKAQSVTWQEIRAIVDQAFDIIYQKYMANVDRYGLGFDDGYDPYKFMPLEYEQELFLEDDTLPWGEIGTIHELADKIIGWSKLDIPKSTKEYHQFCFRTMQMLYQHKEKKKNQDKYNKIYSKINESSIIKCNASNGFKLTELYKIYFSENKHVWSEKTRIEYDKIFNNLIFPLVEISANKKINDIDVEDITPEVADLFRDNLRLIPVQFTKRFNGKFSLQEVITYAKEIESGIAVNLDVKTVEYIREKIKPTTLNRKYLSNIISLIDVAVSKRIIRENYLSGRLVRESVNLKKTIRPFDKNELEIIFSHKIFSNKIIDFKKSEYNGMVPYFKYWLPILGLYSGARENELAQLRISDIDYTCDISHFSIRESEDTRVKTKSSIRDVPVHPTLIDIGFLKYVNWLKNKNEQYLFPELEGRNDKGKVVSKWFSYFIRNNLTIENKFLHTIICFHSFRNNFTDEYKQKDAQAHIAGETIGHKTQGITYGVYGAKLKLDNIYNNLVEYVRYDGIDFPWMQKGYNKISSFPWEV